MQLPPLDGANRIERSELKPNAQVLAEADDAQKHPLLIAGQAGEGRVLAFAGDSTWRWQMGGFGEAHRRFWRQSMCCGSRRRTSTPRDGVDQAGGAACNAWARMLNSMLGPIARKASRCANAQFDVAVQTPDGHSETVRPAKTSDGVAATFRADDRSRATIGLS